ncbi:MAG: SDR family oxidoreductase [Gammaproteobacteria bacterium]|nr:SDR family oxidoreductase [Gammaproteobacteria bacterium]
MELNLKNKTALVCGASQGIGRATAMQLAELGANVQVVARNETALAEVVKQLAQSGDQAHGYIVADFDSEESLDNVLAKISGVNILINNAGGPPGGPAHQASPEEFQTAFRRHLVANQKLVRAVLPGMKQSGYGRIINIISTSVKEPIKGLGVSNTIRGAVASWAKTIAAELGPFGITVNNVLPGFTDTARLASLFKAKAEKLNRDVKDIEQEALASVPLGRFATADEIAYAIAFLASPAAAYVNGINLPVDGGRLGSL